MKYALNLCKIPSNYAKDCRHMSQGHKIQEQTDNTNKNEPKIT